MKKTDWKSLLLGGAIVAIAAMVAQGCAKKEMPAEASAAPANEAPVAQAAEKKISSAKATLELGKERAAAGVVTFTQQEDGVKIVAHVVGAPPGTHGFHIHDVGDCSADDFTSAGGHFNPTEAPHGGPNDAERHAGDLGNIVIGADGSAHLELMSTMITVSEDENGVIGRGVILHAKEDDLVSQPTGAAGARLACGVVVPVENA